jgi:hypothetical protein
MSTSMSVRHSVGREWAREFIRNLTVYEAQILLHSPPHYITETSDRPYNSRFFPVVNGRNTNRPLPVAMAALS